MPKKVIVTVLCCEECPYYDISVGKCVDEDRVVEDRQTIPYWCKLEDV